MIKSYLVSDLHGNEGKFNKLFELIKNDQPDIVFIGGDILPLDYNNFIEYFLFDNFLSLKEQLKQKYPHILLILGNDDQKKYESFLFEGEKIGIWNCIHNKKIELFNYDIYGYSFSPPSPFQLKDWEKYDVSRFVDPGCVSPEEGRYSVPVNRDEIKFGSIKSDLDKLTDSNDNLKTSVFLFHTPPYKTNLDRAALDNKMIDYAPADVHVGSIAVRKLIEESEPYLTLHGHIHESTSITGSWKDKIGETVCFNAAHNGDELAVIKFDLNDLSSAKRILV